MTTTVQFSAQIQPQQVKDIAKQGFKTLINNRPDGEEANQPHNADIEQAAKEAGLAYKAILFAGGQLTQTQVEEFAKFVGRLAECWLNRLLRDELTTTKKFIHG